MNKNMPNLKQELGLVTIFSIASGAMISSGIFILPGLAYSLAGPALILSYLVAILLVIPIMLSIAELASAMPKSGGSYFFIERSLGPMAGTFAGLANWLSIVFKTAFALVGIGALATVLYPEIGESGLKIVSITMCILFTLLNIISVKETGRLQIYLVVGLLIILAAYCVFGLKEVKMMNFQEPGLPFIRYGWQSVFAVAGMVFISFGGLTKVVSVSEEVNNPGRNIPMGMFLALGVVGFLYIFIVFVTVGIIEGQELGTSLMPLSLGADKVIGNWGVVLIDLGAFIAFATTANAGILTASRTPLAMSRDGLVPEIFSRTNKKYESPHLAILATSAFIMFILISLNLKELVKTGSTIMLIMFSMQNISVIIMRKSGLQNYRPTFKSPLFPWMHIISTIVCLFLVFEMGIIPLLITGVFVLISVLWYAIYVHRRIDYESAFVHVVKRIVSKEIVGSRLDDELKQIVLERDNIVMDRFDHLVCDALVLDIEKSISAKELFNQVSKALAEKLNMDEDYLFDLFLKREKDSSTVIQAGLAIPHVVVEGNKIFELLLVRCKEGIVFSELSRPVTKAFVLIGSQDERNFHLRALMSIAHIIEHPGFEEKWDAARNDEELRNVILFSSQKRKK